jgi:hypothetical protein
VRIHGPRLIRRYALAYALTKQLQAPLTDQFLLDEKLRAASLGIDEHRRLSYLQALVIEAETGRMITEHPRL